jgi:hypothetical protein
MDWFPRMRNGAGVRSLIPTAVLLLALILPSPLQSAAPTLGGMQPQQPVSPQPETPVESSEPVESVVAPKQRSSAPVYATLR